ncbi:hypothetical protein MJT46_015567 [Ovis ammon polii x Ovis aries]|nr:hypothetical protein MJT46_015567 [Ovis ammon polii x Ovis aries]
MRLVSGSQTPEGEVQTKKSDVNLKFKENADFQLSFEINFSFSYMLKDDYTFSLLRISKTASNLFIISPTMQLKAKKQILSLKTFLKAPETTLLLRREPTVQRLKSGVDVVEQAGNNEFSRKKRFLDRSLDLCGPCTHTQTFPLLFYLTSKGECKYFKNEDADISVIVDGVKCEAMHLSRILPAHGETTCNHIFKDLLNFSYLRLIIFIQRIYNTFSLAAPGVRSNFREKYSQKTGPYQATCAVIPAPVSNPHLADQCHLGFWALSPPKAHFLPNALLNSQQLSIHEI